MKLSKEYTTFSPRIDDPLPESLEETLRHIEILSVQISNINRQITQMEWNDDEEFDEGWLYRALDSRFYKETRRSQLERHLYHQNRGILEYFIIAAKESLNKTDFENLMEQAQQRLMEDVMARLAVLEEKE